MNVLTGDRVVPTISARVPWLIFAITGPVCPPVKVSHQEKHLRQALFA